MRLIFSAKVHFKAHLSTSALLISRPATREHHRSASLVQPHTHSRVCYNNRQLLTTQCTHQKNEGSVVGFGMRANPMDQQLMQANLQSMSQLIQGIFTRKEYTAPSRV